MSEAPSTRVRRWLFRAPAALYRWRLGWLLGHRFVLLTTRGRRSGLPRRTVLEVIRFDSTTRECVVVSGYGERADWYRNLQQAPAIAIETGRVRYAPAHRFLSAAEAEQEFYDYRRRHPLAARFMIRWMAALLGLPDPGDDDSERSFLDQIRMVAFRPR